MCVRYLNRSRLSHEFHSAAAAFDRLRRLRHSRNREQFRCIVHGGNGDGTLREVILTRIRHSLLGVYVLLNVMRVETRRRTSIFRLHAAIHMHKRKVHGRGRKRNNLHTVWRGNGDRFARIRLNNGARRLMRLRHMISSLSFRIPDSIAMCAFHIVTETCCGLFGLSFGLTHSEHFGCDERLACTSFVLTLNLVVRTRTEQSSHMQAFHDSQRHSKQWLR